MAATEVGSALTEAHRLDQARLAMATTARITRLWSLDQYAYQLDHAAGRWIEQVLPVIAEQHSRSVLIAASYQYEFRRAEIPDARAITLPAAPILDQTAASVSLLTQGPIKVKALLSAGTPLQQALAQAKFASALAGTRHAQSGGRQMITAATDADTWAHGVRRVCSANCCAFCALQAVRSYHGKTLAMGPLHDNCHCQPETAYRTGPQDATRQSREFAALYDEAQSDRHRGSKNPGLNAFRRALAAQRSN